MTRFEGQVAVVTGGALGIGGATARKLASEGAKVFIADIDDNAASGGACEIDQSLCPFKQDSIWQIFFSELDAVDSSIDHLCGRCIPIRSTM